MHDKIVNVFGNGIMIRRFAIDCIGYAAYAHCMIFDEDDAKEHHVKNVFPMSSNRIVAASSFPWLRAPRIVYHLHLNTAQHQSWGVFPFFAGFCFTFELISEHSYFIQYTTSCQQLVRGAWFRSDVALSVLRLVIRIHVSVICVSVYAMWTIYA